jgi:uncharacterized protein (DUF169 family)
MKNTFSRREALQLGLSAAMLGAYNQVIPADRTEPKTEQKEGERMATVAEFNRYGEELENVLILRSSPIAVKMLEKEADIPKEAVRPNRDRKYHIAQCQAFALSRREGTTVAMLKEDHWCPTAPMAYGLVKRPESIEKWSHPYDCFEYGKYIGMVTAPLKRATFIPDVVIIYAKPAQLRGLLLSMKVEEVPNVSGHFFPPSCGYSVVNPMRTGKSWVVLPDPGEYQRALTEEGDMMFSVPQSRVPALMAGLKANEHGPFAYRDHSMYMQPDFEQPEFYRELFKSWGMVAK